MRFNAIFFAVSAAAASTSFDASAQTAPPIKPGLWQVHSEREVDGKKAPDLTERLKDLPPEARKQMEVMMKQRGVDMSGNGDLKICLSKESLQKGTWEQSARQAGCKTDYTAQTASRWAWKSVCTQPPATTEGESVFTSPEAYTVRTATTMTVSGKTQTSNMTLTSKWVGGDCGDTKPVSPKP